MKQLLINGHGYDGGWGGGNRYLAFSPGWDSTPYRGPSGAANPDVDASFVVPADGTLSDFALHLDSAAAATFQVQLIKNGSSTNLNITISAGGTDGTDSDTVSVSAGDKLHFITNENSTFRNSPSRVRWSMKFTGTNTNQAILCGAIVSDSDDFTHTNLTTTRSYNHLNSPTTTWATSEADKYFPVPLDGTIKSFYVYVEQAISPTTLVFSIYKNGAEETTSKVTYNNGESGVKSVTGLTIDIAPGDTLTVSGITTGAGSIVDTVSWGIMYSPDTDGQSMVGGYTQANLSTTQNTVQYLPLVRSHAIQSSDIEGAYAGEAITFSKFRILLSAAPGANQTRVFRVRKSGSNGNQTISISGASTTGTDSSNTDSLVTGDTVSVSTEPTTASAAAARAFWSAVQTLASESATILARPIFFK